MFTIKELIIATEGKLLNAGDKKSVSGINIDSRILTEGECFVALRGSHFDGSDYIKEAINKGASAIIANSHLDIPKEVSLITVDDPVKALGSIASLWRDNFDVPTVAITGSNGKSTTKQMLAAALSSKGKILKTEGNYNNLIGLPLTVLRWEKEHKAAVLEMGMNAPGEIAQLTRIARPDVGVITNICPAHLELLQCIENVAKAKGELFEHMRSDGTIVVNLEDEWIRKLANEYKGNVYTFGMQNEADVRFGRLESRGLDSIDMTIYVKGTEHRIHLPIPGSHNVLNAMAAVTAAMAVGMSVKEAINGIEKFEPMNMRMERVQLSNGIQLINDSYNANPLSVAEALRTVSGAKRAGRFVAVLGDMLELGLESEIRHKEIGVKTAEYGVDRLFTFGDYAQNTAAGAEKSGLNKKNISVHKEMDELKEKVADFVKSGDTVLVKGSRGMKMERVVDHLIDIIGVE